MGKTMVKPDESFDKAEDEELQIKPFNKKKVLIYVVPVIVVIGLAVSLSPSLPVRTASAAKAISVL